jgi:hypothetical protein
MSNHASTAVPHRTAAAGGNSLLRRVERHARCFGAGRPSVGGRRTLARHVGFLQRLRGLPVLRRSAHHGLGSETGGMPCTYSTAVSFVRQSVNTANTQAGLRSGAPRPGFSLALRGTAAPGRWGRAGTGCARAGGAGAFGRGATQRRMQTGRSVPSLARSNPSIERTHNGGPQLLASATSAAPLCAAHVKR